LRFADAYFPLSGYNLAVVKSEPHAPPIMNIPESAFLRPPTRHGSVNAMHVHRIKSGLARAAQNGGVYHFTWHPHNFGMRTQECLGMLENILKHYRTLNDNFGMTSVSMRELSVQSAPRL